MLLIDVSNVMYTGASYRHTYFGDASEFKIRSIPYFFKVIASYYSEDRNMIAVFEDTGRIPALAKADGYKAGRSRNPHVEWEITALKKMLEYIGFPTMHIKGQEADYAINNYCRIHGGKEEIYILSADQDLAANVRGGRYSTSMLSYSSVSYNIDRANFKDVTGVDYNFMNINKLLLGCKSDNIKPFHNGKDIYTTFMKSLQSTWKRAYQYKIGEHQTTDLNDEIIQYYNSIEYFLSWFKNSKYYSAEGERELMGRKNLVQGPVFDLPRVGEVDWVTYNEFIAAMNMKNIASIKSVREGWMKEETLKDIYNILRQAQNQSNSMFEGSSKELEELAEVGNINSILGILEVGGNL